AVWAPCPGDALPISAASLARTWKVCVLASARPLSAVGLVQAAKAAASSLHSKLALLSGELKLMLGAAVLSAGPLPMIVSGAVRSTVQLTVAGVASMLPAASLARTWKVCVLASTRPLKLVGLVQAAKAAASSLHSKLAPLSGELKLMLGELVLLSGAVLMIVSGAVRSTVQVTVAEVASVL